MVTELKGITHLHHFYFPPSSSCLCEAMALGESAAAPDTASHALVSSSQGSCLGFTKLNRYSVQSLLAG